MRSALIAFAFFLLSCTSAGATGFSAQESVKWLKENPDAVIVDVANRQSYALGHIKNAISIPIENITPGEAEALYKKLPQGKPVLIYDRAGILSPRAFHEMRKIRPDLEINYIFERPPFDSVETEGK